MAGTVNPPPNSGALTSLKRAPLRSAVLDSIRAAIFSGKFRPGDPLKEIVIARDLGVSQATVREALLQLEHAGLVQRVPNVGSTVTRLSAVELKERVTLRVFLEGIAASEAAQKMNAEDFQQLEAKVNGMIEQSLQDDYFGVAQTDLEFHRCIWKASENRTLYRILDQLTAPLFAFVSILRSTDLDQFRDLASAHFPLIEAMRSGSDERIKTAFRDAIEGGYAKYLSGPLHEEGCALGLLSRNGERQS